MEKWNGNYIIIFIIMCDAIYYYAVQRNGNGKFTSKLEGNYEGSWEDDARHGAGKLTYPNGDVYEGGWELNKVHLLVQ